MVQKKWIVVCLAISSCTKHLSTTRNTDEEAPIFKFETSIKPIQVNGRKGLLYNGTVTFIDQLSSDLAYPR